MAPDGGDPDDPLLRLVERDHVFDRQKPSYPRRIHHEVLPRDTESDVLAHTGLIGSPLMNVSVPVYCGDHRVSDLAG